MQYCHNMKITHFFLEMFLLLNRHSLGHYIRCRLCMNTVRTQEITINIHMHSLRLCRSDKCGM